MALFAAACVCAMARPASDSVIATDTVHVDSVYEEDPYFLLMGEADRAIAARDWNEAVARLHDALQVRPQAATNALLLSNLGMAYTYLGSDSLAIDAFDRALEIAPAMAVAHLGKGRALLMSGRDREAFASFGNVIDCDSLNLDARFYHGMIALYSGDRGTAEKDFTVLKDSAPMSIDTAIALGTLYSLTGREREAVPYLTTLIDTEPAAEYFASLAGCYLTLEDLSHASEVLARGMELFPGDPELYYYRAWLNRDRYRLDDAKKDAATAIELGASPTKVKRLFEN